MLNKKLKFFRTSYKMTQETLALKLGVTRQTVSKWEKGISVPDADALVKIIVAQLSRQKSKIFIMN